MITVPINLKFQYFIHVRKLWKIALRKNINNLTTNRMNDSLNSRTENASSKLNVLSQVFRIPQAQFIWHHAEIYTGNIFNTPVLSERE